MNKDKRVRFAEPVTSLSNISKQTDSLKIKDSNKPLLTSTGVKPTTSASGSKPSGKCNHSIGNEMASFINMKDDIDINTLTIEQYLAWVQDDIRPGVVKPKIGNDIEFEINSNFMRELRRKLFKGTDDEDAHEHVRRVLEIADLFHFLGATHDAVMLRVFPITLKGPTLRWINGLSAG
ncbi:hypothetical protein Tco_1040644, partial [Tanacetum coccineum]